MEAGWILRMNSVSSYFACCIFHIISILFNCISDTAVSVAKAMMATKVVSLCLMFELLLEFRTTTPPQDRRSSAFSHLLNRAVLI